MTDNDDREPTNPSIDIKIAQLKLDAAREITESTSKLLANSMPNIQHTLGSITKSLSPTIDSLSTPAFSNLAKQITEVLRPSIDLGFLSGVTDSRMDFLRDIVKPLNSMWADQFSDITKNIGKLVERSYPPNWRGERPLLLPDNLEVLLLDEGLPLAWVPGHSVLEKVLEASSASERRGILYNNRRGIINSCLEELGTLKKKELREYANFAVEAAESIKIGHWRSSQALSTNIIESMTRRLFDEESRLQLTSHKNGRRIDWKEYPLRAALVFGGVWGSYAEYWPDNVKENIPRRYTRHATTHAVSEKQYTRINSLIAIMHVTAFLKLIDTEY